MTDRRTAARAPGVSRLDSADLAAAAELLGECLPEIPVYAWVLGPHLDSADVRRRLARTLLRPLIAAGDVTGAHGDTGLVGLLAWHRPAAAPVPSTPQPAPADDVSFLLDHPDLAARLVDHWGRPSLPLAEPDAISISIAAVDRSARTSGVLRALVRVVEEACDADGVRFCAWTGRADLRDLYRAGWGLTQYATGRLDDGTPLYGMVSPKPPPSPAIGPRQSRTAPLPNRTGIPT